MKKWLVLLCLLIVGPASAQMVPGLSGSMFFSTKIPSITYLGLLDATGTSASQNYTIDAGPEDSTRGILLAIGSQRGTASTAAITSATINGVSASVVTDGVTPATIVSGNGNSLVSALWIAAVPTGTTSIPINVTANAAINSGAQHIGVYRIVGYKISARNSQTSPRTSTPSTTTLSTQISDALVGSILCNGILSTATWAAPMITDYNTASSYGSAHGVSLTSGSLVLSATLGGGAQCTQVSAAFGLL